MNLIVDKLLINYESTGKGKDILLIHGWGDDHQNLLNVFKSLAKKYKLTSLDLPGFGLSQLPNQPFNTEKYAKIIGDFYSKIKS
jgi:Predicted hydrolases or acyltransferases (alpha/beta hydrolase superfamily)